MSFRLLKGSDMIAIRRHSGTAPLLAFICATISCTSAWGIEFAGGTGTPDDPYVVLLDTPYQLKVIEDPSGAAIDRTEEACFETMPPAFITFSTDVNGLMTVDDVMAGDFWVVGLLGELAPLSTARVYFRVLGDLPP